MTPSHSVDLKMSKITAEGSFKYLTDKKVSIFSCVIFFGIFIFQDHRTVDLASLHYMSQTKTETVNGDLARRVLEFYISIGYDVKKNK